jgi:hypothetical protein
MDSSEEWGKTNDSLWQFCDAMDISRFERFGLSDSTLFRLDALRRNAGVFGVRAEEVGRLPLATPAAGYTCMALDLRTALRSMAIRSWHLRARPTGDLDPPVSGAGYQQLPVLSALEDRGFRGHRLLRHRGHVRSSSLNRSCNRFASSDNAIEHRLSAVSRIDPFPARILEQKVGNLTFFFLSRSTRSNKGDVPA